MIYERWAGLWPRDSAHKGSFEPEEEQQGQPGPAVFQPFSVLSWHNAHTLRASSSSSVRRRSRSRVASRTAALFGTSVSEGRGMGMKKEELDYVLVPLGLAVMAGYHAWLLLRVRRRPATTVIGVNAINRRIWVRHVMEVEDPFLLLPFNCLIV